MEDASDKRMRARELGLPLGRFKPGKYNAITDVNGVRAVSYTHLTLPTNREV